MPTRSLLQTLEPLYRDRAPVLTANIMLLVNSPTVNLMTLFRNSVTVAINRGSVFATGDLDNNQQRPECEDYGTQSSGFQPYSAPLWRQ